MIHTEKLSVMHLASIPWFYLMDSVMQILICPNSVWHMESLGDWYLVQGNRLAASCIALCTL